MYYVFNPANTKSDFFDPYRRHLEAIARNKETKTPAQPEQEDSSEES
jgi:hypothetical protein